MMKIPDISDLLHIKKNFCHPDWTRISERINASVPEKDWNDAWSQAAQLWIEKIRDKLGKDYQIYETANFLIMSEAPDSVISDARNFYEKALRKILQFLPGVASDKGYGKHVVLMFSDLDNYYGYILYFYPPGEHPMSGGVFLSGEGYSHFVFPTPNYMSYRNVLIHELTHKCLSMLPIPIWLNEALAMRMEDALCQSRQISHEFLHEIVERHHDYWNPKTIQQFWLGESWNIPGDSFELSYDLARIIWNKIEIDHKPNQEALLKFISSAHANDAGEKAFLKEFNLSLSDVVKDFLGDGDWKPKPDKWQYKPIVENKSELDAQPETQSETKNKEVKLPEEMLALANLESSEEAWKPADFKQILECATAHGLACLGGQFQFRFSGGVSEMYWLEADSKPKAFDEDWETYVKRANDEILTSFERIMETADFDAEAQHWKHIKKAIDSGKISDPKDYLYFAAYFSEIDRISMADWQKQDASTDDYDENVEESNPGCLSTFIVILVIFLLLLAAICVIGPVIMNFIDK